MASWISDGFSGALLTAASFRLLSAMCLLGGTIFLLDLWTPPTLDVSILYVFVVFLSLRSSWFLSPVLTGAATVVLTFVPPMLMWSRPLDWFILLNRIITSAALVITALLVSARRTAEDSLRREQEQLEMRVQARTRELSIANRALESEIAVRRSAERSLMESQERLARTEAFSLVMVTHVGLDGRWLKVPGQLCDLLGYTESELLARTFMVVTHPDDVEADWSQCQRLIRGDIKSFELEKRYIRKDGGIVWVYLNCSGVYDGNGRLVHFLTYIRDISDRKQVEDVLRLSQARWRSVIETLPIGIAITTVDGKVLDINTAAWRMLGYESKEEVFQAGSGSHFLDSTDQRCRIEKIRMGDRVSEAQYTKKNGTLFWGRCTAAIFSEQDGEVLVINAYEDITEQRKHHETLQHAKEDLQAANQRLMERDHVRTKFVSVVSHELRTPMAAIKGFIDNMLSGVTGSLSERQCDYLQRMQTSLDRLTRLIAQLLDWSGLEMGRSPLLPKPVSPAVLVQAVADNARAVAEPKHIQVTTRIEEPLPVILADSDKVEQILWNLVGNAIKFSRQGGIVTIGCEAASDGGVLFKVTDAGCGIPKEDIPKVFDQFSGVHAPVPGVKGAQLGLYITRSLVLLHGGRIWVESTVGQGSRFFVHLPRNPPEPSCG